PLPDRRAGVTADRALTPRRQARRSSRALRPRRQAGRSGREAATPDQAGEEDQDPGRDDDVRADVGAEERRSGEADHPLEEEAERNEERETGTERAKTVRDEPLVAMREPVRDQPDSGPARPDEGP